MGVATFARRVLVLLSALLNLASVSFHSPPWNNDDENQPIILVLFVRRVQSQFLWR